MANLYATPTTLKIGDDGTVELNANPVTAAILAAQGGDRIYLSPGLFPHVKTLKGTQYAPVLKIIGSLLGKSIINRDTAVGGSDTIQFGPGSGGFSFENIEFIADDRAGIKTTSGCGKKHYFTNCVTHGNGSPLDPNWNDNAKWGVHTYETESWSEVNCSVFSIRGEHCRYPHNIQGDHFYSGGASGWAMRTAFQFVNRISEGPIGKGNILIQDHTIQDVCLEDQGGGSALTFRGGMPDTSIFLTRVKVRLGCDPNLAAPFNENITGALVCDSGLGAHPGGTKELHIEGCDWQVGKFWPGLSGARRRSALIANVGLCQIKDSTIKQWPGAMPVALEVASTVGTLSIEGDTQIIGEISYHGEKYHDAAAFRQAHPECFN